MERRSFLQKLLLVAAGLGLSPGWLRGRAKRYGQALAAGSRKLAVLIGINRYLGEGSALQGCLTDVELQRELLLYRFGFDPADILTLTDGAATPAGIQSAFAEHLGGQGHTAETVVVQFSGYGQWRLGSAPNCWQPVLLLSGSEGVAAMELDSFFRLLEYKALRAGVALILVPPAYTSQTCHRCLHIHPDPAQSYRSGKKFKCGHCGWEGDADLNGANVIALLGAAVNQPRGSWLACQLQGYRKPAPYCEAVRVG